MVAISEASNEEAKPNSSLTVFPKGKCRIFSDLQRQISCGEVLLDRGIEPGDPGTAPPDQSAALPQARWLRSNTVRSSGQACAESAPCRTFRPDRMVSCPRHWNDSACWWINSGTGGRTRRSLDKSVIRSLTQESACVGTHENIFVLGPTGVGKSFVACALAQNACRDGYSAFYTRAQSLFRAAQQLICLEPPGGPRHLCLET